MIPSLGRKAAAHFVWITLIIDRPCAEGKKEWEMDGKSFSFDSLRESSYIFYWGLFP